MTSSAILYWKAALLAVVLEILLLSVQVWAKGPQFEWLNGLAYIIHLPGIGFMLIFVAAFGQPDWAGTMVLMALGQFLFAFFLFFTILRYRVAAEPTR